MKLALGTAQFGMKYGISNVTGKISQKDGTAILKCARANGIDTLDTAIAYGDSEKILGDIGIRGFKVVTKLPEVPSNVVDIRSWVLQSILESAARLELTSLYGILLHRPSQLMGPNAQKILAALTAAKEEGIVNKLGVSVASPAECADLFELYDFDIVQCPFNVIDRRLSESGWLEILHGAGVEVHTRSCFLQGLLLMPRRNMPSKFHIWSDLWDCWGDWLVENGISPVEACLSYVLSFADIDRVVVGVETTSQFAEVVEFARRKPILSYPDVGSSDVRLINPANWSDM